ncbi:MAG TPA: DEAD/DEAH box helicase [Dehalococcoidia bacterium]
MDARAFLSLGVNETTCRALGAMGYSTPTPIQEEAIPILLSGRDLVGQAQTGTGKTAAFGVPIVERVDPSVEAVQALVLVPTRELAMQVAAHLELMAAGSGLQVLRLFGGRPLAGDFEALRRVHHVVVGTPGRVIDHLRRRTLSLDAVRFAVLDEADEMLDIGFADDMETILRRTPASRQTALFSATIPPFILRMIRRYLQDPVWVQIQPEEPTVPAIEQVYYEVSERDKLAGLLEILQEHDVRRALIFRRTQIGVDKLAARLQELGESVQALHGGMRQSQRDRVMQEFRAGRVRLVVATNVAARGLDISDISHVINYDLPDNLEEYVHRIGRTGRAGKRGTAFTFVGEWDLDAFEAFRERFGDALRREVLKLYRSATG